jgi:hypothetical protein
MSLAALPIIADSDLIELALRDRAVPCICGRQHDDAMVEPATSTLDYATDRDMVVERVTCRRCDRTWSRVNCP